MKHKKNIFQLSLLNCMRIFFLLFLLCGTLFPQQTQFPKANPDKILTAELQKLVTTFHDEVGIYVRNLKTGKTVEINADSLFPTASMIKVPIMCGILDRVEKKELRYDTILVYRDSLEYPGVDIVAALRDSTKIPLGQVIMLSMTTSDNTGSLWLQFLAGTGTRINKVMEENGFAVTRVNSRTPGREKMRSLYGWGVTSPREMAELVAKIRNGKMISPWASERMFRNMSRTYWDDRALAEIPPYVHAATKQGAVDESRSEVVLVTGPVSEYVFCVVTKNQQDTSWSVNNEGYLLIRNVSKILWNYFEPKDTWKPYPESLPMYHTREEE